MYKHFCDDSGWIPGDAATRAGSLFAGARAKLSAHARPRLPHAAAWGTSRDSRALLLRTPLLLVGKTQH